MKPWTPLVTDEAARARVIAAIADIVAALEPTDQIEDLLDLAVLRAYVADFVPDDDDISGEALSRAVTLFGQTGGGMGLFGGAARVGWTVAHMADGDIADRVCGSIEAALERQLAADHPPQYDLISGLVGLGVYALERGEAGRSLAGRVLDVLERRAVSRGPGLTWFTPPEQLPPWQRELAPDGYWNLGLAHGVPGVIAVLARFATAGIEVERAARLLDGAVAYLLDAEPAATPRYPAWHAEGRPREPKSRLAWCYGDLGIALALLSAARARGRADWEADALALALGRAEQSTTAAGVVDTGLCHGTAGNGHLYHRLYRATGDERFAASARRWLDATFALRRDHPFAGFPAWTQVPGGAQGWIADASILTGAPGVALALAAMITDLEPAWDRLLLVDV